MQNNLLHLKIRNRQGSLLQLDVKAVTSSNTKGNFDIYPGHANFISLIDKKILYTLPTGEKRDYPVNSALLRVLDNKVDIFLSVNTQ